MQEIGMYAFHVIMPHLPFWPPILGLIQEFLLCFFINYIDYTTKV